MSGAKEFLQVKFLRTLEPLGSLSVDKLEELANKSQVEELPPGRVIFRQGEKDSRCTYLLSGQVELQVTGNPRSETLKAKTVEARYPIAQEWPRPSTCRSKTNVVMLHIDSDLLEILLGDNTSGSTYEVTEIGVHGDPESDWMLRFLQSPAFLTLPTENIQKLLITLEEVPAKSGEVILKQGDRNEYYYIVKTGKCSVSRRPAPRAEEIRLAILGPGDGFGEEALITDGKRNATVTMKEDGVLMRLGKSDFNKLLVEPMLSFIDHKSMMEKVKSGAALIDVRTNKEFNESGIKGSLNIPLSMLRVKSKDLNKTREQIVYCNDGHLSSAAAFLLVQQSLQVFVLEGGLQNQQKPFSPSAKSEAPTPPILKEKATPAIAVDPGNNSDHITSTDDKEYRRHKQKAEIQAKRATDAEQARKSAVSRSHHLRDEANALRAQADRLANKTARAESERKQADEEINRIKQETLEQRDQILATAKQEIEKEKLKAKQTEEEVNRIKAEADEARKRAEEELSRIKREAKAVTSKQSKLEEDFKQAELEKQQAERAAEIARIIAKQEADQVKAEAELIKQQAQQEVEQVRQEMEDRRTRMEAQETANKQASLDEARHKANAAIAESNRAVEEARRQANLEAEAIRKQALKEAEQLRIQLEIEKQQAAELTARTKAEQQLRQQELEEERHKTLEEARQQAMLEAENIRKQAIEEARIQARLEIQRKAEFEAASHRKQSEEVQRKALETARFEAEKIAEAIRQEALADAQQMRKEMETTLMLVESEAKRAQATIEEEYARRAAEEGSLARAAEDAARRAAREADRRRQDQEQSLRRATIEAEEQARKQAETRNIKAKKMAESIKHRMQESNSQKREDEFLVDTGTGPKLAKAKLHVVKGKTILEGEEDIFIFKAPSEKPPSRAEAEELLEQLEAQFKEKSRKELPSFDIEFADEKPEGKPSVDTDSEFSDSVIVELDNISAHTKAPKHSDDLSFSLPKNVSAIKPAKSKRALVALAASIVVMVTVSIVAITSPTYLDVNSVAKWTEKEQIQPQRGLAAMRTSITNKSQEDIESKVKNEAEKEYNRSLTKWQKEHNENSSNK